VGLLRNLYRYVFRESWLHLTGRAEQAESEADGWAFADADSDMAAARARPPYLRYLAAIEEWRGAFDRALARVEAGDPQRRMAYEPADLAELPDVPEPGPLVSGSATQGVADRAAVAVLQLETRRWREDRLRRARERLGLP